MFRNNTVTEKTVWFWLKKQTVSRDFSWRNPGESLTYAINPWQRFESCERKWSLL